MSAPHTVGEGGSQFNSREAWSVAVNCAPLFEQVGGGLFTAENNNGLSQRFNVHYITYSSVNVTSQVRLERRAYRTAWTIDDIPGPDPLWA